MSGKWLRENVVEVSVWYLFVVEQVQCGAQPGLPSGVSFSFFREAQGVRVSVLRAVLWTGLVFAPSWDRARSTSTHTHTHTHAMWSVIRKLFPVRRNKYDINTGP